MGINIRFVTINKKGKLVKNSRKAKPGVKYHVNRVFNEKRPKIPVF
ncbi:hypothetical protein ACTND0_10180 [Lactobacillus amylovorus]